MLSCGNPEEMDVWTVYHPKYGIIYDELEEIVSGKYEQKEKETQREEYDGRTVWPTTEGVQLSLFGV